MTLDNKVKIVTLETAIDIIMLQKSKSITRTARNIIDIASKLSIVYIDDNTKGNIYKELITIIPCNDIPLLKAYVVKEFFEYICI